jgi:hypothetical protein
MEGLEEELWGLLGFVAFECISSVVVEDACIRDCRGLGVCMVDTVG